MVESFTLEATIKKNDSKETSAGKPVLGYEIDSALSQPSNILKNDSQTNPRKAALAEKFAHARLERERLALKNPESNISKP
jgi:hypothetical protein